MKKTALIAASLALTSFVMAGPVSRKLEFALGAATGSTNTSGEVSGYLEEIQVLVSDGVSTGSVVIAVVPQDTTVAAYNIATNSVTDEDIWVPARDATDTAGAALSSDPPRRYVLAQDKLRFSVTGSPTGVTWTARFKLNDN